uniref:Amino acid ABC transporter substrate-binding protein n=1 Tax=uncultured Bacillota bacterium TaxID=344338 RepID=A0A650ENZ9_9FIRM|nr:amino acid ABC transporter substrate-binding protein [uncultured Firmicutes bacterium]
MKKLIGLLLSAMLIVSLAACGNNGTTPTANSGEDTSWDDIVAQGKIVMGVDDEFPPMGYRESNDEIVGFDIDFAKAVASELGVELEVMAIDWSSKEAQLMAGNVDVIWNGYSITDDRKEKVAFTRPYLANRMVIVSKEGYGVNTKEDLKNVKIGVQAMSSAIDAMAEDDIYEEIKGNLMEFSVNTDAMLDLDAGNVKAVVLDEVVADYYISKHPGNYVVLEDNFGAEEYGIGVRKEDKAFLEKLQAAIDTTIENGKAASVSETWFGTDKVLK